jgi:uncharacterized membrane protein YphA (DoxX/SURF4 family)
MNVTSHTNSKKERIIGIVLIVIRILIAFVFIFSGFVKAIDPLGFTYKIEDYLHSFGGVFANLAVLAFPTAVALSTLELALGLCLLFNIQKQITLLLTLAFMGVMTPLTLYIAIKNPVTNCGCFGDALVITNWETFFKNVVFIAIAIILFVFRDKISSSIKSKTQWLILAGFVVFGIGLSVYSVNHLPMIDFLPYKVGVNITEAMRIPEGAPSDKYETIFIYEKAGEQKEFTLENYPKGDPLWKFVDQKTKLISKGFEPKIHDFNITTTDMEDITEDVLTHEGDTYIVMMYDVNKASEEGAKKAELIYQKALAVNAYFYALTASSDEDIQAFRQKTGITFSFYKTDPIAQKTALRANPGIMLLKKGTVVGKWNWRDYSLN